MRPGLLFVGPSGNVQAVNSRGVALLGATDLRSLEPAFPALVERLRAQPPDAPAVLELPPVGRSLRVRIHPLVGAGRLVLLEDPRVFETLEGDVRLASGWQGLARTYRTVVHELKAPLSAIMIHLDLLRESVSAEAEATSPRDRQKRYVSILREEVQRLDRTLAALLTESMPPAEAQESFDLVQLTRDLGTLLAPQARRQNVHLALRSPETLTFVGYRDRLKQALLNITVNALEAMPRGGRVAIEIEQDDDRARVKVSDGGPGISPDVLPWIYESDFTTKGEGSGIGLYVAHAFVQMHGGEIQVQSEPGRGTRVTVDLPLVRS
jgi:signal transduction histidine kinase